MTGDCNFAITYANGVYPQRQGCILNRFIGDSLSEPAQPGRQRTPVHDEVPNLKLDVAADNVGVDFNPETGPHQAETDQAASETNRVVEEVNFRVRELTSLGVEGHVRGQFNVCRVKLKGSARIIEDCRADFS